VWFVWFVWFSGGLWARVAEGSENQVAEGGPENNIF